LSLTPSGAVSYELKMTYRDGTTHFIFEPLNFMAPGGADAAAAGESDPLPWGVCTK